MADEFYVYAYLDPRKQGPFIYGDLSFDFEPFYIGKGKGRRASYHLTEKESCIFNLHKYRRVQCIFRENLTPLVIYLRDNLSEEAAWEYEKEIIALIGRRFLKTGPLTNIQEGGAGGAGNEETRRKNSESHKGKRMGEENSAYGKPLRQRILEKYGEKEGEVKYKEYLEHLKTANKETWKDPEHRRKMHKARIGKQAGEKNAMYGTSTHEQMLKKYGPEEGEKKFEEYRQKLRDGKKKLKDSGWAMPTKGKPRSKEVCQKISEGQKRRHATREKVIGSM
jgi:hypothetical protein